VPFVNPVIVEVGDPGVVIEGEFGPLTIVHNPVPFAIIFPAIVAVVPEHIDWSAPAIATVGGILTFNWTSSKLLAQALLLIFQRKV
jgi:hypothetical protein